MQIHGHMIIRYIDNELVSTPAWYCLYKKELTHIATDLPNKEKHSAEFCVRLNDSNHVFGINIKTGCFDHMVREKLHNTLYTRMEAIVAERASRKSGDGSHS